MKFIYLVMGLVFASSAFAQALPEAKPSVPSVQLLSAAALADRYPAGSIQSAEMADQALQQVRNVRAAIETRFKADERACYPKFFATACLEDLKERRRRELATVRRIEVEATGFKRHARVIERDSALAERQAKDQAEAARRSKELQEKEAEALQKQNSAPPPEEKPVENTKKSAAAQRLAQHQAKVKQREAEESADAQKRAQNVEAYQKKVHDAEARQREIAAKKAAKSQ